MTIVSRSRNDRPALAKSGACLLMEISPPMKIVSMLKEQGQKIPVEKTEALIDTGASLSCIDSGIAKRLGLIPRSATPVNTAGGTVVQVLYDATLRMPELGISRELPVLGASLESPPQQALIGRDILSMGTLIYSGWRGGFEFCV